MVVELIDVIVIVFSIAIAIVFVVGLTSDKD